ncbi:hypothetical protein PIB30_081210 [Stylosanthes scabra]|uniref:Uncharacterized protein n=1 Tax=Stylosanthes scabra TaxID=79078 RepID=A0ABU6RRS6_9FABA|nr:hypothetical protein [Stylosanthes scabra]
MSRALPLPIKEEFPDEQLFQVKMLMWFADIANFKAMKIIFYEDASRKKNKEVSYDIVTVQIMVDTSMEIGQLQKSYKVDFTGPHSSKMHSNL